MNRILPVSALFTVACLPLSAQAEEKFVRKDELGTLVREYLVENPEVLVEAMNALQTKEIAKVTKDTQDALKAYHKEIYENERTPFAGNPKAEKTVVEFFDYNCSACRSMIGSVEKLIKEHGRDVRILFKEYPIFGEESENVCRIALAVNQIDPQNYFLFHQKLMQQQGKISIASSLTVAKELGLNPSEVQKMADSEAIRTQLRENMELGQKLKVRGTPMIIIGDNVTPHAMDYNMLIEGLGIK